jgi:hypothetical protein
MGTRSLTKVFEKWEDTKGEEKRQAIMCMYRQYDGYPSGHGQDLAEFLEPFTIVNGLGLDDKRKIANGMGCLAAQLVAHFKEGPGNIYLYATDVKDCWQEYEYEIEKTKEKLIITVYTQNCGEWEEIFHGSPEQLLEYIKCEEV